MLILTIGVLVTILLIGRADLSYILVSNRLYYIDSSLEAIIA